MKIGGKDAEVVSAVDDGRGQGRGQRPRLQGAGLLIFGYIRGRLRNVFNINRAKEV